MLNRTQKYLCLIDWCALSTSALILALFFLLVPPSSEYTPTKNSVQTQNTDGGRECDTAFTCTGDWIDRNHDNVTAGSTFVIALFTITIFWAGLGQFRALRKSAGIAERALTELERPFVYGGISKPGLEVLPSAHQRGSELRRGELELCIYNFGRTIARLTRIDYKISLAPKGGIAPVIDPESVGGRELPVGTICAIGDPYIEKTNLRLCFLAEEEDIVAGKQSVWVVGFVRYDDIFNVHHISGFAQVFDWVGERFVRRGGQKYNYARTEQTEEIPEPSSGG